MDEGLNGECQNRKCVLSRTDADMLTSRDKPSKCHGRDDHDEQTPCMLSHIPLRQLDAYGEETGCEHDTHNLSRESIRNSRPRTWVEDARGVRTQEDPKARSEDDLIHI